MGVMAAVVVAGSGDGLIDLRVYLVGGEAWLRGVRLYAEGFPRPLEGPALPFTYPPLAAVLFSGLAVLPWSVAVLLWTGSGLFLLTAVCLVGARQVCGPGVRAVVVGTGLACGALLLEPVRSTLSFGQINLLLLGVVALDCLSPRPRWPRGLLIGFAAAIKLTPLVFVLFFLPRKQVKPVLTALASFAGFGLVGFVAAPTDTLQYWFESLLDPGRVGGLAYVSNQSLRGFLSRLSLPEAVGSALWAVLALGVVVLVWSAVRRAGENRVAALLAVAVGGLLISPVSWSHHWVWVVPGLLLGIGRHRWWAAGAAVLFAVAPLWWMPSSSDAELSWSWWQHVVGNSYGLAGVVLLVALALRRVDPVVPVEPAAPVVPDRPAVADVGAVE
ncbi:glycosyltransferase 87 family protein [Actinosynnema sp. NPDC020468]|uniref:glycosyltransferase 87 family protein n=1 Tax=Actinosynnema sp. NPDC020468 TaxID=3154488 RepID=UPI0033E9B431